MLVKGGLYLHVKTNSKYVLIDVILDTTNRCGNCGDYAMDHNHCSNFKKLEHDEAPKMVLYYSISKRAPFVRRIEEFTDGRFEQI